MAITTSTKRTFEDLLDPASGMLSVDPLVDPAWADLLERAPESMIFHQAEWLRLIRTHYGVSISAWAIAGRDGRLLAGIPVALLRSRLTGSRLIALPFSDTCAPLLDPAAGADTLTALAAGAASACDQLRLALEVRGALPGAPQAKIERERYVQHHVALQPEVEQVIAGFKKATIQLGVAKAVREGVTVERRSDREGLERFYRLHTATRRHQGLPTQPRRFILGFGELFDAGLGFVLIPRHAGQDIAAAVFFAAGGTLTCHFAASDRRFLSLRPNNLMFMEAIRWGCEHGQRQLDFGRTDYDNQGLRSFKKHWGAEETALEFTYFGDYDPRLGRGLEARPSLPRRALRATIKHAPPSFGRLVGQTLYRHSG
jgi:CelD/BcsL family acetyltransferase involved in cellulose biosynthesis